MFSSPMPITGVSFSRFPGFEHFMNGIMCPPYYRIASGVRHSAFLWRDSPMPRYEAAVHSFPLWYRYLHCMTSPQFYYPYYYDERLFSFQF